MKVLFISRPTLLSGPGGDTVQIQKTAEYLRELGVSVDIAKRPLPDLSGYDLIHFFNLRNPQDLLANLRRAKRLGLPTVLSTIWGSYNECDRKMRTGLQQWVAKHISEYKLEYSKTFIRAIINRNFSVAMLPYFLKGHWKAQREIVQSVDVILPNSPTELERVKVDLCLPTVEARCVANAVDTSIFDYDNVEVEHRYKKYQGCLISAARIEIRKGQRELIRAMHNLPYKLVLVGKPSPNSLSYFDECKKLAGPNVEFISHLEHCELAQLYKVAKAHVLNSWMETPGLSTLEAGVMGCNIIVTKKGDTEFYFGKFAHYVEPDDVDSIRKGIISCMEESFNFELRAHILKSFTWKHTANHTYEGYQLALKNRGVG